MLSELKEKWLEKFSLLKRASPYPHSSHILASLKLSEREKKKKKKRWPCRASPGRCQSPPVQRNLEAVHPGGQENVVMPGCPGRTAPRRRRARVLSFQPEAGCARRASSRPALLQLQLLALLPLGPWWPSLAGPALHTYPRALLNPVRADPLPTPTCWTGRLDSWALRSFLPPPNCVTLATLLNLFEA